MGADRGRPGHGQVLPLVAVVVVAAGLGAVVLGRLGAVAVARARAVTAADAAALAGAAAGPQQAAALARANGATVKEYERQGTDTEVVVDLGEARARARARAQGGGTGGPAPALRAALARAAQLLGARVPTLAVPAGPGSQVDERQRQGMAVEVPPAFVERLVAVAARAGLCRPFPRALPGRFELCGGAGSASGLP